MQGTDGAIAFVQRLPGRAFAQEDIDAIIEHHRFFAAGFGDGDAQGRLLQHAGQQPLFQR